MPSTRGRLRHARAGASLLELVVVLTMLAVILAIAVPRFHQSEARRATRAAARDLALLLAAARQIAATSAGGAAVHFDADADEAVLTVERDTVRRLRLGRLHGVALGTTRDSLAFDARGLGHGAANLRITLERRTEAETLVVSRLGRVRAPAW